METLGPTDTPADVDPLVEDLSLLSGGNVQMVFQTAGRDHDEIGGVIELDGNYNHPDGRATHRKPSDNSTLPSFPLYNQTLHFDYGLICTNHYLKRKQEEHKEDTMTRYTTIKQGLSTALAADGDICLDDAKTIIARVSKPSTVHTMFFEPDSLMLYLYFAKVDGGSALQSQIEHTFHFQELIME